MPAVYNSSTLRIHLYPDQSILETEWLDFAQGEVLRSGYSEAIRLARQHGVRGWVANQKNMRTIRPTDQDWIAEHIMPSLRQLGLLRIGIVSSDDALNRMGIKSILARCPLGIDMQFFPDAVAARQWVSEVTVPA
ncbi:hypothetical protein LJY25_12550 [Hymenobacter sp. BT175]|uniref:hypothetical protein n=1 Tax=Hymenobacter translucens TaxID=2886507 RepID=UPI001D0E6714|nr:hypothetical protein [Hymenobacter translucens]MCC2547278.1 hypothetical protein [Hymenobacter translucens]